MAQRGCNGKNGVGGQSSLAMSSLAIQRGGRELTVWYLPAAYSCDEHRRESLTITSLQNQGVEKVLNHIKTFTVTTIWMHGRAVKLASETSGCAPPEVPPAQQCCVEVSVQDTRREQRGVSKKGHHTVCKRAAGCCVFCWSLLQNLRYVLKMKTMNMDTILKKGHIHFSFSFLIQNEIYT